MKIETRTNPGREGGEGGRKPSSKTTLPSGGKRAFGQKHTKSCAEGPKHDAHKRMRSEHQESELRP